MTNISFFHKFDNLAAILNILAYFSQTQPEMHVFLNVYVRTYHKDSKIPYVINVHSMWHLAPSEAGLCGCFCTSTQRARIKYELRDSALVCLSAIDKESA